MLVFGHTGITLGVAVLLARFAAGGRSVRNSELRVIARGQQTSNATTDSNHDETNRASWFERLAYYLDLRLLFIGSLLPDIIDKPVGLFFFRETFGNGRIFGHTFLFLTVLIIIGLFIYRCRSNTWLLVLSFGTFTHLVFDQMWRAPRTLLWPAYGLAFDRGDVTHWTANIFHALLTEPSVYVPELVGVMILIWLAQSLLRRRGVFTFIKYGRLQ